MSAVAGTSIMHKIPAGYTPIQILDDSSGSLTLVAGVAGSVIDVWGWMLSANGSSDVAFKSTSTNISGSIAMIVGVPFIMPLPFGDVGRDFGMPYLTTAPGASLVLASTGSVRMSGVVWYLQRPATLM